MESTCIDCVFFTWWDGDFCCMKRQKILQESKDGKFSKDILNVLEKNKNCEDFKLEDLPFNLYRDQFKEFLENENRSK